MWKRNRSHGRIGKDIKCTEFCERDSNMEMFAGKLKNAITEWKLSNCTNIVEENT